MRNFYLFVMGKPNLAEVARCKEDAGIYLSTAQSIYRKSVTIIEKVKILKYASDILGYM